MNVFRDSPTVEIFNMNIKDNVEYIKRKIEMGKIEKESLHNLYKIIDTLVQKN